MGRHVHVLAMGTLWVMAASGLAYGQKMPPPPVPIPAPAALTANLAPKAPSGVLKLVRPLTQVQKAALIKTATSLTPSEQSFDSPIRLNARTPYVDPNNYLAAYDVGFNPFFDPPELLVRGGANRAIVQFRAQPDRTYLVDCAVDPNHVAQFATQVTGTFANAAPPAVGTPATFTVQEGAVRAPDDHHLTFVVRKEATVRDMKVTIQGDSNGEWRLGTCEITPVRGI